LKVHTIDRTRSSRPDRLGDGCVTLRTRSSHIHYRVL